MNEAFINEQVALARKYGMRLEIKQESPTPIQDVIIATFTPPIKKVESTNARTRYERTASYRSLREKHQLQEVGIWKILGEDPNCDMGGPHHQPDLGLVDGSLNDAINYGVQLKDFWTWGAGGDFHKENLKVITRL